MTDHSPPAALEFPESPFPGFSKCSLFILSLDFCTACRILVLQPGAEPMPPAWGAWSLNHWTASRFCQGKWPICCRNNCIVQQLFCPWRSASPPSLSITPLGTVPSSSLFCSSCSKNNFDDLFVFLRVSGKPQHFLTVFFRDGVISQDLSLYFLHLCFVHLLISGSLGWQADLYYGFPLLIFIMIIHYCIIRMAFSRSSILDIS